MNLSIQSSFMAESQPPGPDGLPLVGNTMRIFRDRLDFIEELADDYGDVVYRNILLNDSYMLTHPEDIEQVLKRDDEKYAKMGFSDDQTERACGSLVDTSEHTFDERRETFQAAFHPDRIAEYAETMTAEAERHVADWETGDVVNLEDELREILLNVTLRTLFSHEPDDEEVAELCGAFQRMIPRFDPTKRPIPDWVPTPTNYRYKQGMNRVNGFLEDRVAERRRSDGDHDDLLQMLVDAQEAGRMSDEFTRDELFTMLVASHETSMFSLVMTSYLLAEHPEVKARLQEEVDDVLDGDSPTMEDLEELSYVEKVIRESMRLYPSVYAVPRIPETEVEIRDYRIPEGSYVFMPQWVVHRDERFYDDPETFRPERWTEEFKRDLPEFAYFPFSGGPRSCVGELFAWIEMQLIVTVMAQRIDFDLLAPEEPQLTAGITLHLTNDVEVEVRER